MRWRSNRHSKNVIDRRSSSVGRGIAGGGIGTIVVILAALYFGVDPSFLLEGMQTASVAGSDQGSQPQAEDLANDPLADRVSRVIADTEVVWQSIFAQNGRRYEEPRLVLFRGATRSACGLGQAAMGPFYCPADKNAYIDLGFYQELEQRFGAPGDFAQAYVIAHEIGHHVQNLLGISGEVHRARQEMSTVDANQLSVRLELQADCLAGVWANRSTNIILEDGDIEEALNAASAIGDDRLQRQSTGTVTPDSFTHGSSEQRRRWFLTGMQGGNPDLCDTFSADRL
ncbi:MAG: neutral zinc metallopeptidase [Woeseiaceae bacterium]